MNGWDNSASAYGQIPLTVSQFSIKLLIRIELTAKGPEKAYKI